MTITLEEITQREECVRKEIVEREHLLAAYQILRQDIARLFGNSARLLPQPSVAIQDASPAAQPLLPPAYVPPPRYINPEFEALRSGFGNKGRAVAWAIAQMTEDYSLRDIKALLKREGWNMPSAQISVVLTRLKNRGEIEEIECGGGRKGSLFRKPASVHTQEAAPADTVNDADLIGESLAAESC